MATILVVDDRANNRNPVVTLINGKGHRALEATDGAEALELVRSEHPDLVISDILLPTMDGFEFVRQLRADPALAATEVIFCSAHYHEREARNLAKSCGVTRVLTKPCEPETLVRAIDQALAHEALAVPAPDELEFDREHLRVVTGKLSQNVAELRRANQRLSAMTDFNLQLASERDPRILLRSVCRDARYLVAARFAVLCVRDKADGHTSFLFTNGIDAAVAEKLPQPVIDAGIFAKVLAERRPLRFAKTEAAALALPAGYPAVESALVAPIATGGIVYGWICLINKLGADEFDEDDAQTLISLGAQVGSLYESGNMYAELRQHASQLEAEVTARKEAEEELRSSKEHYRLLFEGNPLPMWLYDAETLRFLDVNAAACGKYGYSRDEFLLLTIRDIRPREDIGAMDEEVRLAMALEARTGVWRHRTKDGAIIKAEIFSNDILFRGRRARFVCPIDVTQRLLAEEEVRRLNAGLERRVSERTADLEMANRELEAFSYTVSHDLRAPLRAIESFNQILQDSQGARMEPSSQHLFERINQNARAMDKLIDDLLAFAQTARQPIARTRVDLRELVDQSLDKLRDEIVARKVEIRVGALPDCDVDAAMIAEVFQNLLANALKYTRRKTHPVIEVGSRDGGGEVAIFVRDNGIGFDMIHAESIFGAFQRLHSRAEFEGSGVGLAIVQRIINRHGGRIWAEGKPDEGATFWFTLASAR
jgi:PAS domain S-box-containing protein